MQVVTSSIAPPTAPSTARPHASFAPGTGCRVAVIGAGISGLGAAWRLQREAGLQVTLFEKAPTFGGHAHTVDLSLPDALGRKLTHGVDTGFLVYNERTYPQLIALFQTLGVRTARSDMSFSVQAPDGLDGRSRRLEWNGSTLDTVFAQRRNLVSPAFYGMLREILRFNRLATDLATSNQADALAEPLGDFLQRHRFGHAFREGYLLPMIGCIWSCPLEQMLQFPVATLIRFCHNHGLLQVEGRPAWHTVAGGSRHYVRAIVQGLSDARAGCPVLGLRRDAQGVTVHTAAGSERFDAVVLACHAPQALKLLGDDARPDERSVLGALRTQKNVAVLHTDERQMPVARKAWAAWNFERAAGDAARADGAQSVCLHYWINRLQPLPFAQPVIVSLNPLREPRAELTHGRFDWEHPVFDAAAIESQRRLPQLQGRSSTWYAGAWCGYGFHEDGLRAGLAAAEGVLQQLHAEAAAGQALQQQAA
ncbi:MAG: FAD-dependent oxidoreductase [Rubrivivax sp.]|nr:FAD-dependent oxidoreductase [Rubrivivax sp.]